MRWQQRARLGIAIFGIAFAGVVFFAIGEREPPVAAPAPERLDPSAMIETSGCLLRRVTGTREDFTVTCDRQLAYENGDARLFGVRIDVKERQGRDFVITGTEARANEKSREITLTGNVTLRASDGFELTAATASFHESDGLVRTPGAIAFHKGTMRGTGVGMTYDKNRDVLTIADEARVQMAGEDGNGGGEFTSGLATLDRQQNLLLLERAVHAVRGGQTIDADRATGHLTENEEALTAIELRGNARVAGGSEAFEGMSARDIDLHYSPDGETLERVVLTGAASLALKASGGGPGREMLGESLTVAFAPDGSVLAATGRGNVQLDLPAGDAIATRRVRADALDASGEAGKGMTAARFTGSVEYREESRTPGAQRVARAGALEVALDGDALDAAIFSGRVTFEDGGLRASAAEARYEPGPGTLRLTGADEGGGPRVADEKIAVEAAAIDVTLEGPTMKADGGVKTLLQGTENTPGLLKKEMPTTVNAATLVYEGGPGRAVYTGTAQLWQGETAIRGDRITIDQENGNLAAAGNARSSLALGDAASIGRAEEIRYQERARQITFAGFKPAAAKPRPAVAAPATGAAPPPMPQSPPVPPAPPPLVGAHLSGPQGDLRAGTIVVVLQQKELRMERLEGHEQVTLRVDDRVATGARMTYYDEGRYVLRGEPGVPVKIVEACRETTGRTLTFFKSTDRIIVDGNEEIRTRTTSGGPCPQPPSP